MIELVAAFAIVVCTLLPASVAVAVIEDTGSTWHGVISFVATWFVLGSAWVLIRNLVLV